MKRIMALICTTALLCTLLTAVTPVSVSATDPWEGWTLAGDAKIEDGVLHMISNAAGSGTQATKNFGTLPQQYTVMFSMKINKNSTSMGLQGGIGERAGFYIFGGYLRSMDTGENLNISDMGTWRDYMIEVDHDKDEQKIYVDEVLVGTQTIKDVGMRSQWYFWATNTDADFEVSDFVMLAEQQQGTVGGGELLSLTKEYTEAFRQEWDEIGGWTVETGGQVIHHPEDGIVQMRVSGENLVYRSIERPLRPPLNYDMEWRIKFPELVGDEQQGAASLELSTDSRHTWISIKPGCYIHFNNFGQDGDQPLYEGPQSSITYGADNEWHTWKAEVRAQHVTWYIDGKELVGYEMLHSNTNRWHVALFQQNYDSETIDVLMDWVEYTPYFEEELKLDERIGGSVFAEGRDIELKAMPAGDVEKVDYYVNNVLAGSGYKADAYIYKLKNPKVGAYTVKAKVGEVETVTQSFMVKKSFEASLVSERNEINYGEAVKVKVNTASISAETAAEKAEFYLNGKLYSTDSSAPFEADISGMQVGTGTVYAKVYNKAGTVLDTEPCYIVVNYVKGQELKIGREYEINYSYSGSGDGKVLLEDGYFTLDMRHNGSSITYKTDEGEKTYENLGAGDYKLVVTAGYVEFYWKNQFVDSFLMPYTPGKKSLTESGVENFGLKGSGVKAEVYHTDWEGKAEFEVSNPMETYYYSVEFDKTDASPEIIEFNDGVFENYISFREDGIYANRQLTREAGITELKLCDKVEPGYYRLTVGWGMATLYCNNKAVGYYRCPMVSNRRMLKRTMTNPAASTLFALKNTDDIYYHSDNFEDETEFASENYWMVQPETYRTYNSDNLKTEKKQDAKGNSYMNISGSGIYIMNAIDKHPTLKWRGMVNRREGEIYTIIRLSFGDCHAKVGYNFNTGKWFYRQIEESGKQLYYFEKDDPSAYQENVWYDFELVTEGFDVILLCNGKEVFRAELDNSIGEIYYGRMGFGAKEGAYNFDDVEYVGKNRVTPGVNYSTGMRYNISHSGVSTLFYEGDNGEIYGIHSLTSVKSTDKGKTWTDMVLSGSGATDRIFATNMTRMPDGTLVRVDSLSGNKGCEAKISKDNGKSWSQSIIITEDGGGLGTGDRLTCTMDGRIFVATALGSEYFGWSNVYYSDDGVNWHQSETVFNTYNTGIVMNECFVIDTPRENEVWFVARSDSGFVDYWISKDGGKSFDLEVHHIGLIHPQSTCKINRDWDNPDTYYAIFLYDTATSDHRYIQMPRNRVSVAVSHDGMKTWEYVTDLMEASEWNYVHTSDSSCTLIDDHLYWRTSNMKGYGGIIFGSLDLNMVKPLKRMPELHYRNFKGYDLLATTAQGICVLPKADGSAWIYGDYYDVKVENGRIDADTASKVFGVTVNGTVLTLGDSKVTFTEGSNSYSVNGEAKTASNAAMQNGYFDLKTLCEIYGKVFRESETSYSVLENAPLVDNYQEMIDGLALAK